MLTLLKEDIKKRYNKPGNVYLGLVHRLDRPVGGVMVLPKPRKPHQDFQTRYAPDNLKRYIWQLFTEFWTSLKEDLRIIC